MVHHQPPKPTYNYHNYKPVLHVYFIEYSTDNYYDYNHYYAIIIEQKNFNPNYRKQIMFATILYYQYQLPQQPQDFKIEAFY